MTPNRVNGAHWPTKKNMQKGYVLCIILAHGKIYLKLPQMEAEAVFPTNPSLADILGGTDYEFDKFYFLDILDPRFLDFQIPGFLDSRLSSSYICPGR